MEGSLGLFVGGQGVRIRVILFVRECIWNTVVVLLGLPTFDDTDFLGYPPRWVIYHPSGSTLVTASRFLPGNRELELKPTTFSSLLLFSVFPSLLLYYPALSYIATRVLPGVVTP